MTDLTPEEAALLTEEREIWARAEVATRGPWQICGARGKVNVAGRRDCIYHKVGPDDDEVAAVWFNTETGLGWADAQFIAHARTDIPGLLSTIATLRARLARAEGERVPPGWRLVPRIPTEEMVDSGVKQQLRDRRLVMVFTAMADASPSPPGAVSRAEEGT